MAQFQLISSQLNLKQTHDHDIMQGTRDTTHSFVNPSDVIGRDDDKAEIIDMLMSKQENTLPVILIVGIGGLGKTTLAKSVYNDQKVVERFDLRLWVCVSVGFLCRSISKRDS